MENLKPCPFCRNTDGLIIKSFGLNRYGVECINCKVKQGQYSDLDVAISAWNMRGEPPNEGECDEQ